MSGATSPPSCAAALTAAACGPRRLLYVSLSRISSHAVIGLLGPSLFQVTLCISRQKHLRCSAEADHRE
jgi:hypothetical protein